jgi:glycosyltransferase involved in cell wall biosynthesis
MDNAEPVAGRLPLCGRRILVVAPQVPWPASQGTTLRNLRLARALGDAGAVVDLLAFGDGAVLGGSDGGREVFGSVRLVKCPTRQGVRRCIDFCMGLPDLSTRLRSAAFEVAFADLVGTGNYDAVHLEGFEIAHVVLGPEVLRADAWGRAPWSCARWPSPLIVFDDHNAEFELQRSAAAVDWQVMSRWPRAAYSAVQARRLRRREALYAAAADICVAVSEEDASSLREIVAGLKPLVVPNGIDVSRFGLPKPAQVPTVCFAGKLDYRPNIDAVTWFVNEILPSVRTRVPTVRVVLAGRDPSPTVRALASPSVEVTGYLSDVEMRAYLASAWVSIVPLRMGSGTRFKVLEAMAAQVPVVSTSFGAAGSGIVDGVHGRLVDDPRSFATAVSDLLADPATRGRIAARAYALACELHDWSVIVPRLVGAYARALARPSRGPSVIATVRNEEATVGDLIDGLEGQSLKPAAVILVDGGSTDATVARAKTGAKKASFPVDVHVAPGVNIATGRNLAVGLAREPLIASVDAGTVLHPDWLACLTTALDDAPEVDVASGFFVGAPESRWERALSATTLPAVEDIDPARFLPSSRSVAFRRAVFEKVKGYPEWLDYGEDLVFDLAMRRTGATFRFVPRAIVRFRPRATVRAFFVQYYRYARGDGKAGLFALRHAIRYAAYLAGVSLASAVLRDRWRLPALTLLAIGGTGYVRRPMARLFAQSSSSEAISALPWVLVVRVVGDIAKMLGYPVGLWWRWTRRENAHDRRHGGAP